MARDHEHVYLELTAAYSVRGALEIMIEHAGSEKILFGTDHPWFDPRYGIGCILSAYMTDEDRRNILYRNAQRVGLPIRRGAEARPERQHHVGVEYAGRC